MRITGKTLIEMGYRPGKWFKEALAHANAEELSGDALKNYLDAVCPPPVLDLLEQPVAYFKNIEASNEVEAQNLESVAACMNALMRTPTVVNGAIMPDACPTGGKARIPVGGVAVTRNAIHPSMHSADICCSVMLTSFGKVEPRQVLDAAHSVTHFGGGGRAEEDLFELPADLMNRLSENYFLNDPRSAVLARTHLGTQGDGNHFLYVGVSRNTGETVMVTHHGSRGLGAHLYKKGLRIAEAFRKQLSPATPACNAWIPYDTEAGENYWEALQLIREWTKLNHTVLHDATCKALEVEQVDRFWNEHNFVFKDGDLFYHAKGATPLDDRFVPDSKEGLRLIPLNMREPILVVRGETTENNLGFAPHGAGRNVSRSQHKRNLAGKTNEEIFAEETAGLDVRFFSGNIDVSELPSAYKNAAQVQEQMETFGLGEVVDLIMPYGCIMAGDWQIDKPWLKKRKAKKEQAD